MSTETTNVDTAAIRQRLDQAIADALPVAGGRVLSALRALRRELDRGDVERVATADRLSAAGISVTTAALGAVAEEESFPIRSSLIAVSSRYTRAAGEPQDGPDWVRLRTGSGRTYEGYRDSSCAGDGVVGHAHDIRCVRTQN